MGANRFHSCRSARLTPRPSDPVVVFNLPLRPPTTSSSLVPCLSLSSSISNFIQKSQINLPLQSIHQQKMPKDNHGQSYSYKSSGTNSNGNHYCARDYGTSASNSNSYHYSNNNGSYYYSNSDGSSYYNNGAGSASYTPASGSSGSASQGGSSGKSK
jgi:hypothetical protein